MGLNSSRSQGEVCDEGGGQENNDIGSSMFLSVSQQSSGRLENKLTNLRGYMPLYKSLVRNDWYEITKFIEEDPEALRAKITIAKETILHVAINIGKLNDDYIEELISKMSYEDLTLTDQNGETALSVAAVVGNIKAAKLLVDKNPNLPNIFGKEGLPIHRAAQCGQKEMVWYLLDVTSNDIESRNFTEPCGRLLIDLITSESYDIALKLVESYPEMAMTEIHGVGSPLAVLAGKTTAFPSGNLTYWQQLYSNRLQFFVQLEERRQKQHNARELVKRLCTGILELEDAKAQSLLSEPLFIAARLGTHEIIKEILDAYPAALWASNDEKYNVFQLAVLHRRENVFNLLYQMSDYNYLIARCTDENGNNLLHLAGKLPSSDRLNLISGAAWQVERELQWFKELRELMHPSQKEALNKDGKTPWMVFKEAHQDLIKEGEIWIKTTATSCTIAATFICTVAFQAGINVPSSTDRQGHPLYTNPIAYGAFIATCSLSFFPSIISVLMFLSVLTSRYSEDEFGIALPRGLMVGLSMLIFSILSLFVSIFSAAAYFYLSPHSSVFVIPAGFVVMVTPITLFMLLPPLCQIIFKSRIIGTGIVHKKRF